MASQLTGASASLNAPGAVPGAAPTVIQGVLVANNGIVNAGGLVVGPQLVVTGDVPNAPQIVAQNGLAGAAQGKVELFASTDGTSSSVRLTDSSNVGTIEFIGTTAPAGSFNVTKPTSFSVGLTANAADINIDDVTIGSSSAAQNNYALVKHFAGDTPFSIVGVGANDGGFQPNSITTRVANSQLEFLQWGGTLDASLKGVDVPSRYTRGLTVNSGSLSEEDLTIGATSALPNIYNSYAHWAGANKYLHIGTGTNIAGYPPNAYSLYGVFNNTTAIPMSSYLVPDATPANARVTFSVPVTHVAANQSGTTGDVASGFDIVIPGITQTSVVIVTMEASSTAPAAGVAFLATPVPAGGACQVVFPGGGTARFNWFVAKY